MRYENSFVMNDYIHVSDRNEWHIWFEPIQPLCVLGTIAGSVWAAGDPLFEFVVGLLHQQGIHYLYRHGTTENVGMIWRDHEIVLSNADRYPQDIYLCLSYELDGGDDGEPESNWKKEGF